MDAVDMRILRTLGIAPYVHGAREGLDALKPSTVARKLGISLELAKDRIARMEQRGVIAGYELYPNPRIFGLEDVTYHMVIDPAAKERVLAAAPKVPGVVGVYDFIGGHVCVQMFYREPRDVAGALDALARAAAVAHPPAAYFQRKLPEPPRAPTSLDLRILRALRRDARAPLPKVAAQMRVSARTVKRRLARLADEGQFDVSVEVDWGKLGGVLAVDLGVLCEAASAPAVLAAARREFEEHSLGDWRPPSDAFPAVMLNLWARSATEAEALRRRAERLPGATGAWAVVNAGGTSSAAWLDEALDGAIARASPDAAA